MLGSVGVPNWLLPTLSQVQAMRLSLVPLRDGGAAMMRADWHDIHGLPAGLMVPLEVQAEREQRRALLRAAKAGDAEAVATLWARYRCRVWAGGGGQP